MRTFDIKPAIGTSSLGLHPSQSLDDKVLAAARHGFTGIEVVYDDLERYSASQKIDMALAAGRIRRLCLENGVDVLALCPFENFEGHKSPLGERLAAADRWMKLARILGATYLQVPAQYGKDVVGDETVIVSELQQLADLGSSTEPVISIAYEPMSWSIFCSTWQDALRIANLVNRPNFGLCLDSFHIATKLWGSPYNTQGKYPDGDQLLARSLREFVESFPLEKLFYIQLSDGERFDPPFSEKHPWYIEGEAAEFTWSKHARPFPLETECGGYMPVTEIVQALVVAKGFSGWVSLECFDRRTRDASVQPEDCAMKAGRSMKRLQSALQAPKSRL
ncbi:hypothetical protein N0V83_006471 [Neocucurbitaria cava]|uniref:Xylose isomerase-like TIM barrel domain-containing protein n=1 Tax=Neocucurbitaria cava TaxID=798079 RepID=A0A9W9CL14_9PLEO|nr:hypothetical protein N0V83_006471 [Neocucurbitaria cava]